MLREDDHQQIVDENTRVPIRNCNWTSHITSDMILNHKGLFLQVQHK